MKRKLTLIIWVFAVICIRSTVQAQESLKIKRLPAPVEFDGLPFEAAWEGLEFMPLKMNRPNFGNEPSEISEVMLAYDNEYLWVGARLYMRDAKKIFANSKKRDEMLFGFDSFGILLDSYNDNENALAFFTTPTGLRTDYAISDDAAGGGGDQGPPGFDALNFSWNTFWDVKTSRDDKGWYVEMRIPFSSIRFRPQDDLAAMGLIISRTISANSETDTWPAIDPKYGFMATSKPSQANTIVFEGARPSKPVYISPFVIGGYSRDWELDTTGTKYVSDDNPQYNAGLDIKYSINSNLTLDLTANTDFAQVEADDQQVNLTRYDLFFPEKRAFFQERSNLFSYSLGGMSDIFNSRNIGISEDGSPIRIYGGARLTGRIGKWDVGLLDMQTKEYEETPGENFGVLRMRRQVINPNSFVGGIFTSRLGMNGEQNFAYGLDGIIRLFGDDYLSLKAAQSYDKETDNKIASIDPAFFMVNLERRSEEGFAYNFNYSYSGQEFNPGMGFVQRPGIQGFQGGLLYGWIPGEESKLFNYMINLRGERYTRLEDGELESLRIGPGFEINTKKEIGGEMSVEYQEEGVSRDFQLSDSIWIKAGNYSFMGFRADIRTPESKKLSVRLGLNGGGFFDGQNFGIEAESMLNISSSLQLSAAYEFNAIRFPDRETNNSLDVHSANVKALFMLNTKISASILAQYVNTEDDFIFNFRFRYNPREGNDFYIVYNGYRGLNGSSEIPAPPDFYNRTIMLKYTHTFIL
jgi:hypothetical protein